MVALLSLLLSVGRFGFPFLFLACLSAIDFDIVCLGAVSGERLNIIYSECLA